MNTHTASRASGLHGLWPALRKLADRLVMLLWGGAPGQYRPERHYMRGPGPQWRAMHAQEIDTSNDVQIPIMLDHKWD